MPKKTRKRTGNGATKKGAASDNDEEEAAAASASAIEEIATALAASLRFDASASTAATSLSAAGRAELPELLTTLRQLRQKLGGLRTAADAALGRFAPGSVAVAKGNESNAASYVEMKVQVLLSYIISLVYYLRLKVEGEPVRDHPVVLRLMWARTLLEKLRPVDQRLQYQLTRSLQWADKAVAKTNGDSGTGRAVDPHALRPGELAATVDDEEDGDDDALDADEWKEDDVYRPPKVSQVEYTGDHVTAADRAEKDLERKRSRLERSDFVRTLREEFTDAPTEVHGRLQSAAAEKAARKLAEQQEYEEENMVRLRTSKRDTKAQKRLLKQTHVDVGGAMSLDDAVDFRDLSNSLAAGDAAGKKGKGKGRKRGSGVLQEFQEAQGRARRARSVVESTLSGDLPSNLGGGKRRRAGGGKGK